MAKGFNPNEQLSQLMNKLWDLDENRCIPGEHYELDLQGYVCSTRNMTRDWANEHLFTWVDEEKVFSMETYKAYRALLNNYESESGKAEEVTAEEEDENCNFLDAVMKTAVMQEAHQFLVDQDRAPEDVDEFKHMLYTIWFKIYRRLREHRHRSSSGFEHVFVGETRDRDVIGFHNWIQFYLQEKRGNIDYRGFFRRGTANEVSPRIVTLQFIWNKEQAKPIGSSFIGTSPEFELALYTIVFLMRDGDYNDRIQLSIQDYEVEVICHGHGKGIGTAYPISKCD